MRINSNEGFGDASLSADLRRWYGDAPGSLIAAVERQLLGRFLPDLFGFHIVQLGCHHVDGLLDGSRVTHKLRIDLGHTLNTDANLHCVEDALPLAPNSIDVLVLPHVLEYALDAHRTLREAERVLIGEGLYGWTTVADTTDWRYWAVELLIGVAITTAASARSQYPRHVLPTMAAAISTAAVVFAFYRLA